MSTWVILGRHNLRCLEVILVQICWDKIKKFPVFILKQWKCFLPHFYCLSSGPSEVWESGRCICPSQAKWWLNIFLQVSVPISRTFLIVLPSSGDCIATESFFKKFFIDWLFWEQESVCERETLICSTYWCTHWLILVCALTGDRTHTLMFWDDALTNWATGQGNNWIFVSWGSRVDLNIFHLTNAKIKAWQEAEARVSGCSTPPPSWPEGGYCPQQLTEGTVSLWCNLLGQLRWTSHLPEHLMPDS